MKKFRVVTFLAMIALLLVGCTDGKSTTEKDTNETEKKAPIAIQGAMDVEISALLDAMGEYKEEKQANYSFFVGEIDGTPVVVSRTEIGMVNAATSTTILIEKYHPKMIINQGTAGGHDPDIHVFDTVIGNEVMNIGSFRSDRLEKGEGMKPENWAYASTSIREANGETTSYETFESDPELVKVALSVADEYKYGEVVEGKIGSGDWWNREIDRINWFHENFGTSGEEMEAFAVAQVAHVYEVPFLSLRTISNSEVTDDNIEDLDKAGQYGAEFSVQVVKALAK